MFAKRLKLKYGLKFKRKKVKNIFIRKILRKLSVKFLIFVNILNLQYIFESQESDFFFLQTTLTSIGDVLQQSNLFI